MKKRKDNTNLKLTILFIIMGLIILGIIIYFIYLGVNNNNYIFSFGEPSEEFCNEKCGEYDLLYSNNNTEYKFIRCECIAGKTEPVGYKQSVNLKTFEVYFDSNTLEEISKNEVKKRIS